MIVLPIGDHPNPRATPWVNWCLIAANVGVYLLLTLPLSFARPDPADPLLRDYVDFLRTLTGHPGAVRAALEQVSRWDLFVFAHGFRPAAPSLVDLATSMFLHGGFLHLAGNMLFLWIYGDNVEARMGPGRYLAAYLGTGVAATLTHALFASSSPVPMVGASGAISGVLGFYFLWFPRNRVKLFVAFFPFFIDVMMVPARFVLGLYLVVDNLLPFLISRSESGVAHGAHIGGFVAGWAVALLLERRKAQRPQSSRAAEPPAATDPASEINDLVRQGDLETAADRFLDIWRTPWRTRVDPGAVLHIASHYERPGWGKVALSIYQRYLADHPRGPWRDRALLGAGLVQLRLENEPVAAYQNLVEALENTDDPEIERAAREALDVVYSVQRRRFRR